MPNRSTRRTRLTALTLLLLVVGATVACSSDSEGSDPTTTIASAPGSSAPDDDEEPETPSGTTGTTIDREPRTGTSLAGGTEDPPTGDETEDDYGDALVASFTAQPQDLFTVENIECIAPKWARAIGVEPFQAAGITPTDIASGEAGIQDVVIDREAAERIVEVMPECGVALMVVFVDGLPTSVKDDPAAMACIERSVTEAQISEALIAEIMGAEGEDPEDLAAACIE